MLTFTSLFRTNAKLKLEIGNDMSIVVNNRKLSQPITQQVPFLTSPGCRKNTPSYTSCNTKV